MAKADIHVRLIPDLTQFKKEIDNIVKGAAKGATSTGEKDKKDKKESSKILGSLNKSLKFLGAIAIAASLMAGIFKIFEPILKLWGVVMALLFVPLIPIMKKVLIALGEFAKKAAKNVSAFLGGEISLTEFFENVFGDFGALVEQITPIITDFLSKTFEALTNVVINNSGKIFKFILKFLLQIGLEIAKAAFKLGKTIGQAILDLPKTLSKLKPKIKEFINGLAIQLKSFLLRKLRTTWENFITGLKNIITSIKDKIKNVWLNFIDGIKNAIKGVIDKIKNFRLFNLRGDRETKVGDAIIRPNGQIIRTDPRDTLIATKNPESLGSAQSITFSPTIILQQGINSKLDIRKAAEELAQIGFEELTRRTGGLRI